MLFQNYYLIITDYKCKKLIVEITFEPVLIYGIKMWSTFMGKAKKL